MARGNIGQLILPMDHFGCGQMQTDAAHGLGTGFARDRLEHAVPVKPAHRCDIGQRIKRKIATRIGMDMGQNAQHAGFQMAGSHLAGVGVFVHGRSFPPQFAPKPPTNLAELQITSPMGI